MLIKYSINEAKTYFFDRPIADGVDQVAFRGLSRFGAFVRRDVRRSLRKARQKTLAQLTDDERERFRIRQQIARDEGRPRPKRPLASSRPGEPPRMIQGDIKKFLFFAYEPQARSVVIGPARTSRATGAPEVLEEGGYVRTPHGRVRIEKRPYMRPPFAQQLPSLPRMLRGNT